MTISYPKLVDDCARRIYAETLAATTGRHWASLQRPERAGFKRMVATVFDVLFEQDPKDIVQFFTDGRWVNGQSN